MSSVPKCARLESGFTLMELMVSISIFVIMTVLLIVKFGNFNQNTNITNLAYDIALTLRTAQTYGMSVQGQATGAGISPMFQYSYGVAFCALASGSCPGASDTFSDQQLVMFADTDPAATRGAYDNSDINISPYNIKHGAKVLGFCSDASTGCSTTNGIDSTITRADITFIRPNPDAIICVSKDLGGIGASCVSAASPNGPVGYLKIVIQAADGSVRDIIVRRSGQISVEE